SVGANALVMTFQALLIGVVAALHIAVCIKRDVVDRAGLMIVAVDGVDTAMAIRTALVAEDRHHRLEQLERILSAAALRQGDVRHSAANSASMRPDVTRTAPSRWPPRRGN